MTNNSKSNPIEVKEAQPNYQDYGTKTWKQVSFTDVFPNRKRNRILGLTFPNHNNELGLEPSLLTVLPDGDNVEYCTKNILFNDNDVDYYVCSVYISGMKEFKEWALEHDQQKIIVGGYHPTSFPKDFIHYAHKVVLGPTDNLFETIEQNNQIVHGITDYKKLPRYDLWDPKWNQQIIPDKKVDDVVTSINTSMGCPMRCDFCATPLVAPKMLSKPIQLVEQECDYLKKNYKPKWIFIRDENFPLQTDWPERLNLIKKIGAKIYMFASANLLQTEEIVKILKKNNVYMVCLGLEDPTKDYAKNKNLDQAVQLLKKHKIMSYLSFIVNPLEIIGKEKAEIFYNKLMDRFFELKPEMVCGNFLMPFPGTGLWDTYYANVNENDYQYYDSKTPFLVANKIVQEKMKFFMFWHQWIYYTSDFYKKNVRNFQVNDTLHLRFEELYKFFKPKYERYWSLRS